MLWQYRCGSPCEMKFISVVCGLAVIQKQPRLVDRAFNRASPSDCLPGSAPDLCLPSSLPFWLLLFPPTHSSALSPFPNPAFLTQQAALPYPLHCGCITYLPRNPDTFLQHGTAHCSTHMHSTLLKGIPCLGNEKPHAFPNFPPCAPWSHTPSGTSMNKSYC